MVEKYNQKFLFAFLSQEQQLVENLRTEVLETELDADKSQKSLENCFKSDSAAPLKIRKRINCEAPSSQSQIGLFSKAICSSNKDESDIFGNYVASKMRTLCNPRLKRKMERQISQVISNILVEEDCLIDRQQMPSTEYVSAFTPRKSFYSYNQYLRPSPYDLSRGSFPHNNTSTVFPACNYAKGTATYVWANGSHRQPLLKP